MKSRSGVIRLATLAALIAIAGLMSVWTSSVNAQPSPCGVGVDCDNEMKVETVATPTALLGIADVDLSITKSGVGWQGYGAEITYDNTKLAFVPAEPTEAGPMVAPGLGDCGDTVDNDLDGFTDAADPECPPTTASLQVIYTGLGSTTNNATASDAPGGDGNVTSLGSARGGGTTTATGVAARVFYQCLAAGTHQLRLIPPDPTVDHSTTLGPGGTRLETGLTAGSVTCQQLADVTTAKTGPASVKAGVAFDWVSTVHNAGPNNAAGVVIGDNLPEIPLDPQPVGEGAVPGNCGDAIDNDLDTFVDFADSQCIPAATMAQKTFNSATLTYNAAPSLCAPGYLPLFAHPLTGVVYSNIVFCSLGAVGHPLMLPSDTAVLTVNVTAPLWDAGKLNVNVTQAGSLTTEDPDEANEADCALTGLPPGNLGCAFTQVLPGAMTITKVADKASYSEGDTITWTVTATCLASGSACTDAAGAAGPAILDDVDLNQDITGATLSVAGACLPANPAPGAAITCTPTAVMSPGDVVTMTVLADVVDSEGSACVNEDASVTWGEPTTIHVVPDVSVTCLAATVRMQKDIDPATETIDAAANLWLCEGPWPACAANGAGKLVVAERVFNVGTDTDGVGAYEFQIKFDHKIFDVEVADTSWLSNGGTRAVQCGYSIVTENWILWGCVSSGQVPGQLDDGTAANITLTPESDLKYRLTPGNNNGIFRVILDENCEIADVLGHPLEIPGWATDGLDNDGDTAIDEFGEGLAPGVVTGGLIDVCSDLGVTVRILEGDLDLDCDVDVADEQAIAFRYGASFGLLLYDPWFDLEPAVKDFDIDIKDLQKVFGRDGSTCAIPIPAQPPVAFP